MQLTRRTRLGNPLLLAVLTLAFAPGCELATHFGDFQQNPTDSGGLDGAAMDAGDTGAHDAGHDSAMDANVDAAMVNPDGGGGDSGVLQRTVHVTIAGAGSGTVDAMGGALVCASGTCDWSVDDGTTLTIHPSPNATSTLGSWGGACGTTANTADCSLTITADVSLTATFDVLQVRLTVVVANPPGTVTSPTSPALSCDGTNDPTGCVRAVAAGTTITLTAAPSLPNTEVAWGGVAGCSGLTCAVTVNADMTVTATFSDGRPVLNVNEAGQGTVSTSDSRIDCVNAAGDCSEIYDPGTTVTLTATPGTGYTFGSWTGCDSNPTADTCTITLAAMAHATVTATFTINHYTLTVNVGGTALGSVTSSSPTLTCTSADGTCVVPNVAYGTSVTLTAAPDTNAVFQSWSGIPGCGASAACTFTMTSDANGTATFIPDTRQITLVVSGADGQVTSSLAPFNCVYTAGTASGSCTAVLNVGSTFDLTVVPHAGYHVTSWSSSPVGIGCSGSASSCMGTVVRAIPAGGGTVTVTLAPNLYTLDVVASAPTGGGTVASQVTGMGTTSCVASAAGAHCPTMYPYGTIVTLTAMPDAGSVFLGWSGACAGVGTCMVTMDASKSVTANFSVMTTLLQVNTSGAATGTVTSTTPSGAINCGSTCAATLAVGTAVTLHATPAANYAFTGWSGLCSGTGDCNLTIASGSNVVTATFTLVTLPLVVSVSPAGGGTVTDNLASISCPGTCSANYAFGATVTLTPTASAYYLFSGWSGCTSVTGTTCNVTMDAAHSVSASFVPATGALTVSPTGTGQGLVRSGDGAIMCNLPTLGSDNCSSSYTLPSTVVLSASPAAHSHVSGWAGCSSVSADMLTCTVSLTGDVVVRAFFDVDTYLVSVTNTPSGLGTVRSGESTPSIACPGTCSATYAYGATVTLTANPNAPNVFTGWSGIASCGSGNICSFIVTGPVNVTATFAAPRTLTVILPANAMAGGSRVFMPGGVTCTTNLSTSSSCSVSLPPGPYTLASDSQPDWLGPIWSGVSGCSGPQCNVNLISDTTVTVTWAQLGNIAFITSTAYTGQFGGTAAQALLNANSDCQARATSATPSLPGTYIAWLSNGSTNMTTRLPAGDSVWVRPDGRPIATSRAAMLSGALIHPIAINEFGGSTTAAAWTGTRSDGTAVAQTCTDWTSTATNGFTGQSQFSGSSWSGYGVQPCTGSYRLYCIQTGGSGFATVRPLTPPPDAVTIFTTQTTDWGAVSVAGMDSTCQTEAQNAGLTGTYVALVSSSSSSALNRATMYGTLIRPDGWPIGQHATSNSVLWTLTSTVTWGIQADRTLLSTVSAWNGMGANASGTGLTCSDWSNRLGTTFGTTGDSTSMRSTEWAGATNVACSGFNRWYCIQTAP